MKKTKIRYKVILTLLLSFLLLPLIVSILWAFTKNWPWPKIFPESFGLRGWKYFFDPTSNSIHILLFSVLLSFVVTIVTLLITIPASKALALYNFKGKRWIDLFVFAPIIVPPVTVAMGIHMQFIKMGIANTFIGVVLIHLIPCIPYAVRILKSVFEIIGDEMEQQARVLGASRLKTFLYITVPMLMPGMISAGSMVFIVSFSQYFLTFLIGGGKIVTFSMLMFPYIQSGDRMMGSVYSVVFVATTIIFLMMVEKITDKYYGEKLKGYSYV